MKKTKGKVRKKSCFIITPIGAKGDCVRNRVDQWMKHIYKPALQSNYDLIRADEIAAPGKITEQILDNLLNADLALIDYTGFNPNVMYEAAIRHLTKKPFIQIHEQGERLPFDIHDLRSISYDPTNIKYSQKLCKDIKNSVNEINSGQYVMPEILKYKFDFDQIVQDPEKFIDLLKSSFIYPSNKKSGTIIKLNNSEYGRLTNLYGNSIVCPNCGTTSSYYDISNSQIKTKYKCTTCFTEFEK